jgi:hypothetical protein
MSEINPFSTSHPYRLKLNPRQFRQIAACAAALLMPCHFAHAISAGAAPDSPANRVDPDTTTSPFAGVGFIEGTNPQGNAQYGTATLIDSTHILTAAHVVDGLSTANNNITFILNDGSTVDYTASSYAIAPNYNPASNNDLGDLAIVTLSTPVPNAPTYSLDLNPITSGTVVTFVGYGQSGDGVNGYSGSIDPTVKRTGQNAIDGTLFSDGTYSPSYITGSPTYLFDFDGPAGSPNYLGGTTLGNDTETTIGNGDSGAPAFIQLANGQYQIAAIADFAVSFNSSGVVTGQFGDGGGGAVLSAYSSFLAPYAAPEPGIPCVLSLGGLFLLGSRLRARRRI